ncbi:MAG: YraN family protein [Magnetococcales bacterium]|nr:YraN family protein [Magnetococcales bacterium]
MTEWRKWLGDRGEQVAESYVKREGFRIVDRNVRTRFGEMDLIAMDGDTLVFCEVRSRGGGSLDEAAESIGVRKQQRLIHLAQVYLQKHPELADCPCRFDAILLQKKGKTWLVERIADAFRPGW